MKLSKQKYMGDAVILQFINCNDEIINRKWVTFNDFLDDFESDNMDLPMLDDIVIKAKIGSSSYSGLFENVGQVVNFIKMNL